MTNLERNLYLTTQILEIDVPVVIALNMVDLLEKQGASIDIPALEKSLGVPIVLVSALKNKGIDELIAKADKASNVARKGFSVLQRTAHSELVEKARSIAEEGGIASPIFHAVKMLEWDEVEEKGHPSVAKAIRAIVPEGLEFDAVAADERYRFIESNCSIHRHGNKTEHAKDKLTTSDKIDRVMTNKWLGIPIFLLVLLAVFAFTFSEDLFFLGRFGVVFQSSSFQGNAYFEGLFWHATEFDEAGKVVASGGVNSIGG